jgi:hypothetical protein
MPLSGVDFHAVLYFLDRVGITQWLPARLAETKRRKQRENKSRLLDHKNLRQKPNHNGIPAKRRKSFADDRDVDIPKMSQKCGFAKLFKVYSPRGIGIIIAL